MSPFHWVSTCATYETISILLVGWGVIASEVYTGEDWFHLFVLGIFMSFESFNILGAFLKF